MQAKLTKTQIAAIKTAVRCAKKKRSNDNVEAVHGLAGVYVRATKRRGFQYPYWQLNFCVEGKKFTQGKLRLKWVLSYAPTTTMSQLVKRIGELLPLTERWVDA